MGEQSTKEKGLNIGDIIAGLSEISRRIEGENEKTRPQFTFNDNVKKDIKPDSGEENRGDSDRADDLPVKVYEDIDIKDVSKGS